ncbi:carbamoyltransferase [Alteromonas facilis]|uniref:carbamoyltransferase family protein n=1 Tax=Alteromonas facilis TaxID=2048004 RepID=UPI000C295027|nr:carbamoyltransferase [Alteromonas facilis]
MPNILGISAYYHDSAACIVVDGQIVAAAQEERFSRKKHDPRFPRQAIQYCLHEARLDINTIDVVVFYDKPLLKFERLLETYLANAPKGFFSFARAMPIWLKEKLYLKSVLRRELRALRTDGEADVPQLLFTEHHQSHAASAFYPSPFSEAAVICLDGVGEWTTTSIWHGKDNGLIPLHEVHFPHSLGLLYSAFTYHCGFRVNAGEYKLMGLAPYGEPRFVQQIYQHLIDVKEDGSFSLNMRYFDYAVGDVMTNKHFSELFGVPVLPADETPSQVYCDLARSIQVVTQDIVIKIARHARAITGAKYLCMAGGVALNCVANAEVMAHAGFEDIWIQPAAGDAGGALGAALEAWFSYFNQPRHIASTHCVDTMQGAYLGPEYSDDDIHNVISQLGVPAERHSHADIINNTVDWLASDQVIGWFQGRMEFGPRALGNRSILGDARSVNMQRQMNVKIKQRESFRPFAPVVLEEKAQQYFETDRPSPYMLLTAPVHRSLWAEQDESVEKREGLDKVNDVRSSLPAITHIDYSARLQTVAADSNPLLHELLLAFEQRTGTAVLINTSFNVRGEPPVCSPADAIRCFLATEMDFLVMGQWVLDKRAQSAESIKRAKAVTFEKD